MVDGLGSGSLQAVNASAIITAAANMPRKKTFFFIENSFVYAARAAMLIGWLRNAETTPSIDLCIKKPLSMTSGVIP